VKYFGERYQWSSELQRKLVHISTGLYALSLPLMFSEFWPIMVLVAVAVSTMLVLRRPQFAKTGLSASVHGVDRQSYGELMLAVTIGFVFYFSMGKPVLYVLPITILTLSDAAAALIGTRYGRTHFPVEAGTKSVEGVAMFFMVTWIVAMILLLLMTDIERTNVVLLSLIVAGFGALVEADSWRGFDNLFVPVGILLFLYTNLETPPTQLLVVVVTFIAILTALLLLAPSLGLTRHAARAYAILIFLITATTAPYNAILPVAAVLAHIAARQARPSPSAYPDLDLLAMVTGVALFWLFVGEFAHHNALDMYNLAFAGAAAVYVVLAAGSRKWLAAIICLVLYAVALGISELNATATHLQPAFWPWILASFALCLVCAIERPALFDRYRCPRIFAVAMIGPLSLFLAKVTFE
jgi:phytol kinase